MKYPGQIESAAAISLIETHCLSVNWHSDGTCVVSGFSPDDLNAEKEYRGGGASIVDAVWAWCRKSKVLWPISVAEELENQIT